MTSPDAHPSAHQIRQQFIDFFEGKHAHTFVPSSPVAPINDPTLLFTNAGMNQFKPVFLGAVDPASDLAKIKRAVNSQKCIRAGGKHNDLDDVGKDLYHHTFFEMLGNWSFGDFFKAEIIDWAWELFTEVWKLDPARLYATYFEGDDKEGLEPDHEAKELWLKHLPEDHVLPGDMKDNFWEMGDTGPCGPCSEIHYDGRPDAERNETPGAQLVNADHEQVIELWNLVFIQFDRFAAGKDGLKPLPEKHVDTGMGLERIARVLQGKNSNYATDLFTPLFAAIQKATGCKEPYTDRLDSQTDTAYRVIADHIRCLTFAITDGADPSNEGRGYVLRRILRRAVRFGRQTLGADGVFLADLVPTVVGEMGDFFPELKKNPKRVVDVIREEEESFGRTLKQGSRFLLSEMNQALADRIEGEKRYGLARGMTVTRPGVFDESHQDYVPFDEQTGTTVYDLKSKEKVREYETSEINQALVEELTQSAPVIPSDTAFKLHDTYGFPIDLTQIMAEERGLTVDVEGFHQLMEEARERSRAGGAGESCDTKALHMDAEAVAELKKRGVKPTDDHKKFERLTIPAKLRAIWTGERFEDEIENLDAGERVALITDKTNFYAEMGGQVGDQGEIHDHAGAEHTRFTVENTVAVGGYVLHVGRLEHGKLRLAGDLELRVDSGRRKKTAANHTATHLLNLALREEFDETVDQKGSLVAPDRLRFDFSLSGAVKTDALERIEAKVAGDIDKDLPVSAQPVPLEDGKKIAGLRAVFGETYPDPVRVVAVGAAVPDIIERPQDDQWRALSIEFCGGTHLRSTAEAEAFVITEETAVAKGVRRISALTGKAASEALERARELEDCIQNTISLPDEKLEAEAAALAERTESETLPLTARRRARAGLDKLADRVKAAKKKAAAAGREDAVAAARQLAESAEPGPVVGIVPAGSDRAALLAAMDAVRARRPDDAVMLLSAGDKVAIAASVPEPKIKAGLKAGDWVRAVAATCGGKGGGKPDKAQGGGTEPDKIEHAAEMARRFAADALGSPTT